jgi:hypothetical protein
MKKALVILYYWPPAGGSAVQRWLKFCKYLRDYGWEPVVYAPENPQYPEIDKELENEIPEGITVIRQPILEPFKLYKKFVGIKKEEKLAASMTMKSEPKGLARIKNKLAFWVRSNFFIPDARCFWIRPSVKYLKGFLREEKIDLIITTGPPQSIQMIGYHLHKKMKIPWVADFRDPWTSIDFYNELKLTRWADSRHHMLESRVLRSASHVIAIGPNMKEEFERIGAKDVTVITNGYDDSDLPRGEVELSKKFSMVHLGTLSATRNSAALWRAISEKVAEDSRFAKDLELRLYGNIDHTAMKEIESRQLTPFLTGSGFVPHKEAMKILAGSQVLLLLINKSVNARGVITGKFFEYLATGRPILLIGPLDGDAAKILMDCEGGLAADFDNAATIRKQIDHLYDIYLKGEPFKQNPQVMRYSRKELTKELAKVLDYVLVQSSGKK